MKITNIFICSNCNRYWNEEIDMSKGEGVSVYKTNCPICNHKISIPIFYSKSNQENYWPEYLTKSKDKKIISIWLTRDDSGYQGIHSSKPVKRKGYWVSPNFSKPAISSELYPKSSDECIEFVIISKEEYERLENNE